MTRLRAHAREAPKIKRDVISNPSATGSEIGRGSVNKAEAAIFLVQEFYSRESAVALEVSLAEENIGRLDP